MVQTEGITENSLLGKETTSVYFTPPKATNSRLL